VAASMPVVRFGGEGKQGGRGESGVKRGECDAISGRGGVVGAVAARVGDGGGGARSGFRRKKKVGPADRAGPPVSEGEAAGQAGSKGKGGRWAVAGPESLLRLKSKEVKENQFLINFWIKIGLEIE
jgi:hypothetical protein